MALCRLGIGGGAGGDVQNMDAGLPLVAARARNMPVWRHSRCKGCPGRRQRQGGRRMESWELKTGLCGLIEGR